ncbi:MAG: 5'-methylthioadenosine/S-adenosylhomocysteine nucleosidase [Nitratireductor sp.]
MKLVETPWGSILFLMAARAEYGPQLQSRFDPLFTGVGPVEAGIVAAGCMAELKSAGSLPSLVVCLGSAGSRSLEQTTVYQAVSVGYRDMDASALGFEKGLTPFLDLPATLPLPFRIPDVPQASLSTGANIVSGAGYDGIDADMVDMETFAVLRAAMIHDVPLIGLRGISDGASELHHIDNWTQYLHVIDGNLAIAVDRLMDAVGSGQINIHPNG